MKPVKSTARSRLRGDHEIAVVPPLVATSRQEVQVTPCPDGPLLVRGADTVVGDDGRSHEVTRPVVAVCVCGKSQRRPWCDGTHKVIPKR